MSLQLLLGFCSAALSFAAPFLTLELTQFIKDGSDSDSDTNDLSWDLIRPGVIYSGILVATQVLAYVIGEHMSYYNVLMGRRSSNAVIAFVY